MVAQPLTNREREILTLMAHGLSVKETAVRLSLSPQTVKNHRSQILKSLGARNGVEAVFLALQRGLIDDGDGADVERRRTDSVA
jgi:DNA-binding NarL/FixJ family response regulator